MVVGLSERRNHEESLLLRSEYEVANRKRGGGGPLWPSMARPFAGGACQRPWLAGAAL